MIFVLILLAAVTLSIVLFYETVHAEVTETTIASDLVEGQLKIVHISDLHGRTRFWTGTIGEIVDSLKPDIVCVTGDLFNRLDQLPAVMDELSRLECKYLFFVPGNHEWEERVYLRKRKFTEEEHSRVLKDIGVRHMRVLANEGELVQIRKSFIYLYGFDNSVYGRERFVPPQQNIDGAFSLTMAHSPSILRWLHKRGIRFNLLLSGHTHGGQIRLFGKPFRRYGKHRSGLNELEPNQYMYNNRGLGTIHLPFRFGCRPEVALIRIVGTR
ncbi:MAG: hypothetical protein K0Q59_359 [Paenibacillus sp.]|jgi:predicted MPP superfamily phosphohydrolase|nr:hypothetical protein [Paenibacillus sp.]